MEFLFKSVQLWADFAYQIAIFSNSFDSVLVSVKGPVLAQPCCPNFPPPLSNNLLTFVGTHKRENLPSAASNVDSVLQKALQIRIFRIQAIFEFGIQDKFEAVQEHPRSLLALVGCTFASTESRRDLEFPCFIQLLYYCASFKCQSRK